MEHCGGCVENQTGATAPWTARSRGHSREARRRQGMLDRLVPRPGPADRPRCFEGTLPEVFPRRLDARLHFGLAASRSREAERIANRSGGGVYRNAGFDLTGGGQAPQRYCLAAPVLGVLADLEGTRETRTSGLEIVCLQREFSKIAFAFALQFLVLDASGDDQTLFEELLGTVIIGLSHGNFAQVGQADGLSQRILGLTEDGYGLLFKFSSLRGVILLQVKGRERGKRRCRLAWIIK